MRDSRIIFLYQIQQYDQKTAEGSVQPRVHYWPFRPEEALFEYNQEFYEHYLKCQQQEDLVFV
jgi:hypothetical protein